MLGHPGLAPGAGLCPALAFGSSPKYVPGSCPGTEPSPSCSKRVSCGLLTWRQWGDAMRIVLSLHSLAYFAGTETYSLCVATELRRLGHEVFFYATELGPIADVARADGYLVTTRQDELPIDCDGVLAQDAGTAFMMADRYPEAGRVMVVHSEYHALQYPPQLSGVVDTAVVMNERVRRRVEHLAAAPRVVRLRQPVDLRRFGPGGQPDQHPRRALILGNYLRGERAEMVTEACRAAGLEPSITGALTQHTRTPERDIAASQVVIGLGRCAVEAMAGGRAAYVFGIAGGDGWVTTETYEGMEADGFAGTAGDGVVDSRRLAADLAAWGPEMGQVNRQVASAHHDAGTHTMSLVDLLQAAATRPTEVVGPLGEMARLVRMEWDSWTRYTGALLEVAGLREELHGVHTRAAQAFESERHHHQQQLEAAETQAQRSAAQHANDLVRRDRALHEVETERDQALRDIETERDRALHEIETERDAALTRVEEFRSTRRYRLAARLAAPVDRLRESRGR